MYAAFQQFAPESDVGIDLSVEYRVAIRWKNSKETTPSECSMLF